MKIMLEYDGLWKARGCLLNFDERGARKFLESIENPSADTLFAIESLSRKYAARDYALGYIDGRLNAYGLRSSQ